MTGAATRPAADLTPLSSHPLKGRWTGRMPSPWVRWASGVVLVLLLAGMWAEWQGWPWLAAPIERAMSTKLGRPLRLHGWPNLPAQTGAVAEVPAEFSIRFLGGVKLQAAQLELSAPPWGAQTPTLLVTGLRVQLRYVDLMRAWRGGDLRLALLQADHVDAALERLADGRASWTLETPPAAPAHRRPLPQVDVLLLRDGQASLKDAALGLEAQAQWTVSNLAPKAEPVVSLTPAPTQLSLRASGQYQTRPLKVELTARTDLSAGPAASAPLAANVVLHAVVGRAQLDFDGSMADALGLQDLQGHFKLQGPSLAAVGDPVGVTLPTTGPFRSQGNLRKVGAIWWVVFDDARIGGSRLHGAFSFDRGPDVPLLTGRLSGSRLLLRDLGPAVGVQPASAQTAKSVKVLPDRPFDLVALRAMDANVLVDIDEVDLNTSVLEPLHPLRAHLQLNAGVLNIGDLEARMGSGRLRGDVQLDGRRTQAAMRADLRWDGLRLERWIHQPRPAANAPPYVSGALQGMARLQGQGHSTAQVLAQLKGTVRAELREGRVSHLAVEAAGLDVAQGLGVLIKGDDALQVSCAVADVVVDKGVFVPRAVVLDNSDSTLWMDGSLSLANETLDLRLVVSPKDFSPLALRTPIHVRGSLAQPKLSVNAGQVARRVGLAALLGFVNPLAALLPLIDPGDRDEAAQHTAGCKALLQRSAARCRTSCTKRSLSSTGVGMTKG
jgi:AsmA family protein